MSSLIVGTRRGNAVSAMEVDVVIVAVVKDEVASGAEVEVVAEDASPELDEGIVEAIERVCIEHNGEDDS